MDENTVNLDKICFEYGIEIPRNKEDEVIITNSIGVLQENGILGLFLYLNAKEERKKIGEELIKFCRQEEVKSLFPQGQGNFYTCLKKIAEELDDLIFLKELLEKVLIYARYHAKALCEKQKNDKS